MNHEVEQDNGGDTAGAGRALVFTCSNDRDLQPREIKDVRLRFNNKALQRRYEAMEPLFAATMGWPGPMNESLVQAVVHLLRSAEEPLIAAFLARSLNALANLAPCLSRNTLGEATGQTSDYEALATALQQPPAFGIGEERSVLQRARLRFVVQRNRILESEGGALNVEETARLLGLSRQAVYKARCTGRLLALPLGERKYVYPAWQFTADGGPLLGLAAVLADLTLVDSWARAAFFLGENTLLNGRRPLDELRHGEVDSVRRAAQAAGEQGAG